MGILTQLGIAAFVVLAASAWSASTAYKYANNKCNAAALASEIVSLKRQLSAHEAAAKADAAVIESSRAETEQLEGAARELSGKIGDRVCFSEDDANFLRRLWGGVTVHVK